jgi:hypothetical protein
MKVLYRNEVVFLVTRGGEMQRGQELLIGNRLNQWRGRCCTEKGVANLTTGQGCERK